MTMRIKLKHRYHILKPAKSQTWIVSLGLKLNFKPHPYSIRRIQQVYELKLNFDSILNGPFS